MTGMRVLFDGFWWEGGPVSGKVVLREMVHAWLREHPQDDLVLAVPAHDVETVRAQVPADVEVVGLRSRPQALAAALELPIVARRLRPDITIVQNYTPVVGRSAVFIHDVLFKTNPEWFTRLERIYFSPMTVLARRASAVFTSSATEARRIERCAPALGTVAPVGLAVASSLKAQTPTPPAGVEPDQRFLLSVCRLNIRKNLQTAIAAALDAEHVTADCPLLVVGELEGKAAAQTPEVRRAVETGVVRFLGTVTEAELRWLYERAALFVFLSLGEGFGLPPVEALDFGCPVLASDLPIFRETLGDGAVFAPAMDVRAAAEVMDAAAAGTLSLPATPRPYSWGESVRLMRATVADLVPAGV